jgi:hypothetical protein
MLAASPVADGIAVLRSRFSRGRLELATDAQLAESMAVADESLRISYRI